MLQARSIREAIGRRPFSAAAVVMLALGLAVFLFVFKRHVPQEPGPPGSGAPPVMPAVPPSRAQEAGGQPLVPPPGGRAATVGVKTPGNKRLLWKIATAGGPDRVVQMVVAGGRLLVARKGVIHALDPASGEEVWRFPRGGPGFRHTESTTSSYAPPMIAALDGLLVTRLTRDAGRDASGLLAIRLSDGREARRHVAYPELEEVRLAWSAPPCARVVFHHLDSDWKQAVLSVFDLETWKEVARFRLPGVRSDVHVAGDWVTGWLVRRGESVKRRFGVNYKAGELHTVPTKTGANVHVHSPLPSGAAVFHAPAANGTRRRTVFPAEAKAAGNSSSVAVLDMHSAFVADAATGHTRLVVPLPGQREAGSWHDSSVAMDGSRLFFYRPSGLAAYSLHPTNPAKADPNDECDPAWGLARCREALRRGDWEDALHAMMDIAPRVQTVPEGRRVAARLEAGRMLSLLGRSPAADLWPSSWEALKLRNGWIAGELFLDDYVRAVKRQMKGGAGHPSHVVPGGLGEYLLMINTRRSLEILSRTLDHPEELRVPREVAALAAECLRGRLTGREKGPRPQQGDADPMERLRLRLPPLALGRFKGHSESSASAFDPRGLVGADRAEKESIQVTQPPVEVEEQF